MELENYGKKLVDVEFWEDYVRLALKSLPKYNESKCSIEGGFPGTYPTFIVDNDGHEKMVVKLYIPGLYDGEKIFKVERNALVFIRTLNLISIPKIISTGTIDEENKKIIHFIIMDFMNGKCVRVFENLSNSQLENVARQLGIIASQLHAVNPTNEGYNGEGMEDFADLMARTRKNAVNIHKEWKIFKPQMIEEIEGYLSKKFDITYKDLFCKKEDMAILHADFTEDHVFIEKSQGISESDEVYDITGIIDFGDVQIGHPVYEIMAAYFGVFMGRKDLLKIFLESYEWNKKFPHLRYDSKPFSYYTFSFCILFQFNIFLRHKEDIKKLDTLEQLEDYFWNLT